MALNSLGLGFVFSARDMASPAMVGLGRNFGALDRVSTRFGARFGIGMRRLRTAGLAFAATGALGTVAAFGMARAAGRFEQGLARVGGVTRATTAELAQLRDRAIQVGIETTFSPDEAVEGLTALATMGFRASEAMALIGPASALAEGGMIGITDAAQAVASATRVFSLSMEEASGSADRLLRITQLTALQAGDLSLALGTVARGAGQTSQNLNEMLIAMGLVRNTGVEVSVAASSVSSALQFMARNASEIQSTLGVAVTDVDGNFRDFLDIVLESSSSLNERFPNAADRATESLRLFGRFGVTAFGAVSRQLTEGVRGLSGELLTGADALAFLRDQMANSTGVADEFRERILATFPGQLQLLSGSVRTLAIVLGENFANAFKPIVRGVIAFVNDLIARWNAIPSAIRDGIASFLVGASAMLTLFGTFVFVSAVIALMIPLLKVTAIAFVGLVVALTPLIALFAAAVIGVKAFRFAMEFNLGGIRDFITNIVSKIRLAWNALTELFTRGGFTSAIAKELNRAENQGLRNFVVRIFAIAFRLQRFWDGLMAGFRGGMIALGPAIDVMLQAFRDLFQAFGFGAEKGEDLAESLPSDDFVRFGQLVGTTVARGVLFFVEVVTDLVDFIREDGIPAMQALGRVFGRIERDLGPSIRNIGRFLGMSEKGQSTIEALGRILLFFGAIALGVLALGLVGILLVLSPVIIAFLTLSAVVAGIILLVDTLIDAFRFLADEVLPAVELALAPEIALLGFAFAPERALLETPGGGITKGPGRGAVGEELAGPVRARAEAREARDVDVQQSIIDALRAQEGGIFNAVLNIDGRRLQEFRGRMDRTESAARGVPVEGDQ